MKTFTATPDDIAHDWHVVDATGVPLGRLASAVAQLIRGKHKPTFTPHMDGGDFVIVINAVQGEAHRPQARRRRRTSGTPATWATSGYTPARDMLAKHPERVIEKAVFGMLPKNSPREAEAAQQAQGLRRRGAPARGAAAEALHRHAPRR